MYKYTYTLHTYTRMYTEGSGLNAVQLHIHVYACVTIQNLNENTRLKYAFEYIYIHDKHNCPVALDTNTSLHCISIERCTTFSNRDVYTPWHTIRSNRHLSWRNIAIWFGAEFLRTEKVIRHSIKYSILVFVCRILLWCFLISLLITIIKHQKKSSIFKLNGILYIVQ